MNLAGARATYRRLLMTDACTVVRDLTPEDPVFDAETLTWAAAEQGSTVYAGPCLVAADGGGPGQAPQLQGAVEAVQQAWTVRVPLAAPVRPGDVVGITASADPELVNARFVVRDSLGGTMALARALRCERWVPGQNQDWTQ